MEGSVASNPVGRNLKGGGREIRPLDIDEALEVDHRSLVISGDGQSEAVGEAGREVRVGEDGPRLAEEDGGVGVGEREDGI